MKEQEPMRSHHDELVERVTADPETAAKLLSDAYSYIKEAYRKHFSDDVQDAYRWTQEGELGEFVYPSPVKEQEH